MSSGDEELVALAQRGDRHAFEDLVDRHKQKAYHIAFGFTRDRESAKDLSQDAFLKAFVNLKNFDGRSGFYTWFYRILVNLCLDQVQMEVGHDRKRRMSLTRRSSMRSSRATSRPSRARRNSMCSSVKSRKKSTPL